MNDYARLLKALEELYNNLRKRMAEVETNPNEPTFNNGYVFGLQVARREIGQLLLEEDQRARRLLNAIFREDNP